MRKQIFIVETPYQLEVVLKSHIIDDSKLYVAMSPKIFINLKNKNFSVISYRDMLEDDYDIILSNDRYEVLKRVLDSLNINTFFKTDTTLTSFKYYLNYLIVHQVFLIKVLNKIVEKYSEYEISQIESADQNNVSRFRYSNIKISPFIEDSDDFLKYLFFNNKHQENISRLKSNKFYSKVINFINTIIVKMSFNKKVILTPTMDRKTPLYFNYLKLNSDVDMKFIYIRMSDKEPIKEILFSIVNMFKKLFGVKYKINGFVYDSIISVASYFDKDTINNLKQHINTNSDLFEYKGISFFEAISDKLDSLVIYTAYMDKLYNSMSFVSKNAHKNVNLVSHSSNNFQELIAEAFLPTDAKSYLLAHGTVFYPKNKDALYREYTEFTADLFIKNSPYKDLVIQSPITMASIVQEKIDKNCILSKPIMWGSTFESFKPIDKKQKNILYADSSNIRSSTRPIHFIDIFEYIQTILDLAKCVDIMDGVNLLVKIRESDDIDIETVEAYLKSFNSVEVLRETNLSECLKKSDIMISRSSTTIEEALMVDIPVLLYDPLKKNRHIENAQDITTENFEIQNYVVYLTNEELLEITIKEMLVCDYDNINNNYTYKDEKVFLI